MSVLTSVNVTKDEIVITAERLSVVVNALDTYDIAVERIIVRDGSIYVEDADGDNRWLITAEALPARVVQYIDEIRSGNA